MEKIRRKVDFSQGERGKFYRPDLEVHLPIYLDKDIAEFLQELSERKGTDIQKIVNDWLRKEIDLVQSTKSRNEDLKVNAIGGLE